MPVVGPEEAELTKLLENTFRHVNIALVNELAMFAARPRHRRLGGDRRRLDQAVRLHALHARARASAATACPIDPSLPVVAGAAVARRSVPLRRAGQRRQRPHARLRRAPPRRRRSTERRQAVNGQRILLLGLAYKRNTGDARESPVAADRPPARRARRRGAASPTRTCDARPGARRRRRWSTPPPTWPPRPTRSSCSSTTTPSTSAALAAGAPYVLDTRHCVEGDTVEYL